MFNYFTGDKMRYNDCAVQGSCSVDPLVYSLSEVLLYELKQITYYIVKMQELGYENQTLKDKIIKYLSLIVIGYEFNRKEFENIIRDIHIEKENAQKVFIKICEEKNLDCQILKSPIKLNSFDFSSIVNEGEKQAILRNKTLSTANKNLTEIILQLLKSASMRLMELKAYTNDTKEDENAVLKLFNSLNFTSISSAKLLKKINDFAKINFEIHQKLHRAREEYYGKIRLKEVSCCVKKGPAILASGQNLKDFELLLEALKGEDINVYTHDSLIVAHSFPKFDEYKNLAGHFQKTLDNFQMDFELFKGAILITKNSQHKLDRLMRGRIFTTNELSGKGMTKIENNDFKPIIEAAKEAKGFSEETDFHSLKVGYNEDMVMKKVESIVEKIKNGKIKHLFIIGLINHTLFSSEYFKEILDELPEDCFAISTVIESDRDNIFHLNSFFNTSLIYKILDKLKQEIDFDTFPITVFLTRCNLHTISHLFSLRHLGVKNIFLPVCSADIITPNMVNFLSDKFNFLKTTSNALEDLKKVMTK